MLASPMPARVRTKAGKLHLFVAIDRIRKSAVPQLIEKANRKTALELLEHQLGTAPYKIQTILAELPVLAPSVRAICDGGIRFAEQPLNRNTARPRPMRFDMICKENKLEHRPTKPSHPWTNGQAERMNRTIKDATVKSYHHESHEQLLTHLADFLEAYNSARRLKTLGELTPYKGTCRIWTSKPEQFSLSPTHHMPGRNTYRRTAKLVRYSAGVCSNRLLNALEKL